MSPSTNRDVRGCRDCGQTDLHTNDCDFMEPRSATREVQDWQRRSGETLPKADGWTQRPEYKP